MELYTMVREQLASLTGLASLQFQNHLYGCYFVMEDLAQGVLTLTGTRIKGLTSWDLEREFGRIGLRYGFIMDTKLALPPCPEYQAAWMALFRDLSAKKKVEEVDQVEDAINEIAVKTLLSEHAFFLKALENGSLNQEWIAKALALLDPDSVEAPMEEPQEEPASLLSQAKTEKNVVEKPRRFARTRSSRPEVRKAALATTRRSKK
jgi:hypothetical protein